jgi:hypothetical protein
MAISGRQVALVTVIAVLGLIVGIALVLYAIPGGRFDDGVQAPPVQLPSRDVPQEPVREKDQEWH